MAGAVAGIYLALFIAASTCLFFHNTTHHAGSDHSYPSTHSPLCAWACQAASEDGLVASAPEEMSSLISIAPAVPLGAALPDSLSPSRHSRAPPVSTFG